MKRIGNISSSFFLSITGLVLWLPLPPQTGGSDDEEILRHLKQVEWPRA